MPHLFASLESILVFAAIVLISALSNWIKQRQERKQADAHEPMPQPGPRPVARPLFEDEDIEGPPPTRPTPRPLDWQEELRRLLEGAGPRPTPPPLPPPPPPPRPPPPRPAMKTSTSRPMPVFDEEGPAVIRPIVVTATEAAGSVTAAAGRLKESAAAYQRGTQLSEAAEARLQTVLHQVASARPTVVRFGAARSSESANRLREQLRNPVTARQAVLASVVLGPPRGLDRGLPVHS